MAFELEFEKPIIELERKIEELNKFTEKEDIDLSDEISTLTERLENLRKEVFENLTSWQRVQIYQMRWWPAQQGLATLSMPPYQCSFSASSQGVLLITKGLWQVKHST